MNFRSFKHDVIEAAKAVSFAAFSVFTMISWFAMFS